MRRAGIAALALATTAAAAVVVPTTAQAGETLTAGPTGLTVDTQPLRDAVTPEGVMEHLEKFQQIATENGGNRRAGTAGYDASVDYVKKTMKKAGYKVKLHPFEFLDFEEERPASVTRAGSADAAYEVGTLLYSGSGSVEGAPVAAGDGCATSAFRASAAAAQVAVVRQGGCDMDTKVGNAVAAGYDAVLVIAGAGEDPTHVADGDLTAPAAVPVVGVADGTDLLTSDGSPVRVTAETSTTLTPSVNVIATSKYGNKKKKLVVGGHLDSVFSAGINDNGGGAASILEIAEQMSELGIETKNQVRFAFWGAEELGLIGASRYVASLSEEQRDKIIANLNFDMVGSTNYVRFVYDGDGSTGGPAGPPGSAEIEATFVDYFESQDLASDPTPFNGRSDYGPFIRVGIPAGGLFSGAEGRKTEQQAAEYGGTAGLAYDPCYHKVCDNIDNVSMSALDEMSDAAAHTTLTMLKPIG